MPKVCRKRNISQCGVQPYVPKRNLSLSLRLSTRILSFVATPYCLGIHWKVIPSMLVGDYSDEIAELTEELMFNTLLWGWFIVSLLEVAVRFLTIENRNELTLSGVVAFWILLLELGVQGLSLCTTALSSPRPKRCPGKFRRLQLF